MYRHSDQKKKEQYVTRCTKKSVAFDISLITAAGTVYPSRQRLVINLPFYGLKKRETTILAHKINFLQQNPLVN